MSNEKLSSSLAKLIDSGKSDQVVRLTVMLDRSNDSDYLKKLMTRVKELGIAESAIDCLDITCSLHFSSRLSNLLALIEIPEIQSIDLDTDIPMKELLDD